MRTPRCFLDRDLVAGKQLVLPAQSAHHLIHVLRMKVGQLITLFNGQGGEYTGEIVAIKRSEVNVQVGAFMDVERESTVATSLGLAILKRQAMDAALVRSTEMGITEITPVITENCSVSQHQLKPDHWQQVVRSSCEQCGRNIPPQIHSPVALSTWISQRRDELCLLANPDSTSSIADAPVDVERVSLLIGPEGGMTDSEIRSAEASGFLSIRLGRRVMRAETVPTALLALVQQRWGDF